MALEPGDARIRSGRLPGSGLFYRELGPAHADEVIVHVHGFAISGSYLLPTASRLAGRFRSIVPDLPGFGRSPRGRGGPSFADLADDLARVLDDRGVERATLLGNSMGCAVICEFDHRHGDRLEHAVLVSPAGGEHNRPFPRAVAQLATDALREDLSMARVAVPDYLRYGPIKAARLFRTMTRYPAVERLLELSAPTVAVLGSRDPLLPGPERVRLLRERSSRPDLAVAVLLGAAHAINYSHPDELAWIVASWLDRGTDWPEGAPDGVRRFG